MNCSDTCMCFPFDPIPSIIIEIWHRKVIFLNFNFFFFNFAIFAQTGLFSSRFFSQKTLSDGQNNQSIFTRCIYPRQITDKIVCLVWIQTMLSIFKMSNLTTFDFLTKTVYLLTVSIALYISNFKIKFENIHLH